MKIVVKTVYEIVTEEWLNWYIAKLNIFELFTKGYVEFTSKDPTSQTVATTSYELLS